MELDGTIFQFIQTTEVAIKEVRKPFKYFKSFDSLSKAKPLDFLLYSLEVIDDKLLHILLSTHRFS